ncbi:hypothetical protein BHE74_00011333 [Ensete ventricosum]|nr:hypothetical protein BHE74_00011333 [Ensete ventricosum]
MKPNDYVPQKAASLVQKLTGRSGRRDRHAVTLGDRERADRKRERPRLEKLMFWGDDMDSRVLFCLSEIMYVHVKPPMTVLEILQRLNHYMIVEVLGAGKRKDHKRPHVEKFQGRPPELLTR